MRSLYDKKVKGGKRKNNNGQRGWKVILRKKICRATYACADQREHDALVQSQCLALFHFDALLVQAFHRVHFTSVGFAAAVDFAESAAADDPVDAEIVHRQLRMKPDIISRKRWSNSAEQRRSQ